ncbi:MAG: 2-hydroxy-3-oxopropionate reductase [Thauera sp.]|nr:2-hydroxy-3-oxopropionate reductase [Thauera sp.]
MDVGFIGLGLMGRPMALRLLKAGHRVQVWSRRRESMQPLLEAGAGDCASAAEVARRAAVTISMVPDAPDVEQVTLGAEGVADGAAPGHIHIDMSTIAPAVAQSIAERLGARGVIALDAPVSGGEVGAKAATLTIMVGGPEATFERAKPLFEKMGKNITLVGGVGDGQTAKVANQIIVGLTIEAVAEGLTFAKKAGADPAKVRDALMGGFASSRILELHGERMIKRTFDPGFRIRLHRKDLSLAVDAAKALNLMLPNAAATQQLMNAAIAMGDGEMDHSALVRTLEALAGDKG